MVLRNSFRQQCSKCSCSLPVWSDNPREPAKTRRPNLLGTTSLEFPQIVSWSVCAGTYIGSGVQGRTAPAVWDPGTELHGQTWWQGLYLKSNLTGLLLLFLEHFNYGNTALMNNLAMTGCHDTCQQRGQQYFTSEQGFSLES